jgi:hypothetical protein
MIDQFSLEHGDRISVNTSIAPAMSKFAHVSAALPSNPGV